MQAAALAVIGYYHNHCKYYFAGESGRYDTLIEEISRKLDDDENLFGDLMNVDKTFPAWVWAKEFKEDFLQAMRTLALNAVDLGVLSMEKDFLGLNISYPASDFYIFAGSQIPELASPGYFSTFKPPHGEYQNTNSIIVFYSGLF